MSESLGKATLELEVNLGTFVRNMQTGRGEAGRMENALEAVAAISKVAETALKDVRMSPGQAAESKASAEGILSGVRGVSEEARIAARELDNVRLTQRQAAESDAAGDVIDRKLKDINRNANETRRALDRVKLAGGVPGRSGVGVGPFGSGFGRVGLLGAGIGAGVALGPAAGPAAIGLLSSIPTLAAGGAGALGTLVLAFQGVGKAIGGDKKAFDDLGPSAQAFVQTVRSLDGWLDKLKQTAAGSLFPGLTDALHSALSPGTLSAITKAVTEFGHALGQAGAQWGKYFGSSQFQQIFGPLMAAGAHSVTVMSDSLLHLFDALGVLGKAAIPFTSWLMRMVDAGSRFADSWLQAKSATGQLGHALDETKTSLTLVVKLAGALFNVIVSLGRALYPVAKVAVKDLTDGLNALAGIIDRNKQTIRDIVSGALAALVSTVKIAAPIIGGLVKALNAVAHAIGGWKNAFGLVIGGFLAMKFVALATKIGGVESALKLLPGAAAEAGGGVRLAFASMLGPIAAATIALYAFKKLMDHLFPPQNAGPMTAATWASLPDWAKKQMLPKLTAAQKAKLGIYTPASGSDFSNHDPSTYYQTTPPKKTSKSPFTTPPPFTKNLGAAAAVIPPLASHDIQLASANASRASALGNVGATAKRYLDAELADLQAADRLIKRKYESATGKARTQLFAALTSVENKMRAARKLIAKAIIDGRAAELQFAVDQAKDAVASATEGSAAYDRAIAAEEKALKAQIAYLDARAKNSHLSLKEREKAIKAETADKKELAALLKQSAVNSGANEAQFLSSFRDIVTAFAPNFFPAPGGGKTDTHLYDIKSELRQQTPLLKDAVRGGRFPATRFAIGSASAVAG